MAEKPKREDKIQRTPDTGIIPGLGLHEEFRDRLAKRDWTKPSRIEDPNNPDTWTTAQCVTRQFSGFRIYHLTREVELWVLGYIKTRVPVERVERNPSLLATMHEEVFQTGGTLIATDAPVEGMGKVGVKKPKETK